MGLGTKSQENSSAGKVRVEGAHRVWGTMKVTSSSTLKHGISRVFSVSDVQIKHKTILDNAGEVKRWWFVVYAPESVLCDLDSSWESLILQTGWKLESYYKPGSQPLATMKIFLHLIPESTQILLPLTPIPLQNHVLFWSTETHSGVKC